MTREELTGQEVTPNHALIALQCMDLTSLNDNDSEASVRTLVDKADTAYGRPAALCVYTEFVKTAKIRMQELGWKIPVATVTNFPAGDASIKTAVQQAEKAVDAGADEVDVVLPWQSLKDGDEQHCLTLVQATRKVLDESNTQPRLKVIIESGELKTAALIKRASEIAIEGGADFIKTSTGKVPVNATPEAAEIMLSVIKASAADGKNCGLKISGGVRTVEEASVYIQMCRQTMGNDWLTPENFRFGASGLLNDVLNVLSGNAGQGESIKSDSADY